MTLLDTVFDHVCELPPPHSEEHREASRRLDSLLDRVETAMGKDIAESLRDAEAELFFQNGKHFFLHGLRLGLDLVKL